MENQGTRYQYQPALEDKLSTLKNSHLAMEG
jgi:hypothetical protein